MAGAGGGGAAATATALDEPVIVFTTAGCPYCKRAKAALKEQQVPYQEVDVSGDVELRALLAGATGERTVPQVFANGVLVGGSDSLLSQISSGSFARLLAQPASGPQLPEGLLQAVQSAAQQQGSTAGAAAPGLQLPPELQALVTALADPSSGIPRTAASSQHGAPAAVFTGRALLDWLCQAGGPHGTAGNRQAAAATGQQLLAANAVTLVSDRQPSAHEVAAVADNEASWYRLRSDAPQAVPWGRALNTHYWWGPTPARPAEVVAEELRGRVLALYDKHLRPDGKAVAYQALRRDPAFAEYVDATAELQRVDLAPLSREALMCFAINTYNALVIHALVSHGTKEYESSTGRIGFFQKAARYNIGGADYVLDDLENGVLRGNRPGAASLGMLLRLPGLSRGPFSGSDPRAKHVVSPVDARIHFALVCGAKSCPPIKLYSTATLEEGLQGAAEAFCASDVIVDAAAKKVTLSKIFSWYYPDFGPTKADRLAFLLPHLSPAARASLQQLLDADPSAAGIKLDYAPYDWTINAADE